MTTVIKIRSSSRSRLINSKYASGIQTLSDPQVDLKKTSSASVTTRNHTKETSPIRNPVNDNNECSNSNCRTPRKCKTPSKSSSDANNTTTPEKQRKLMRDCPRTPSSLLKVLSLTSPLKTPTDQSNPEDLKENNSSCNVFSSAKRALYTSHPNKMPTREAELTELNSFICDCVEDETARSLYICGPPGTGKTAAVNLVVEQNKNKWTKLTAVYINCTAMKSATGIYSTLIDELHIKTSTNKLDCNGKANVIAKYLQKCKSMILLILDEIDQLETSKQSILYTVFEWPSLPNSRLILIGIANALDLTDRILPRLHVRHEFQPKLLHFAPYTKQQIIEILTKRLENGGALHVFSAVSLQMLAAKVAAISGDIRRALDIGRRVVDVLDKRRHLEILKTLQENQNKSSDWLQNHDINESEKTSPTKIVDFKEIVSILNTVYGTVQQKTARETDAGDGEVEEDSLPIQQKITICALLLILKRLRRSSSKNVTIGGLHEIYGKICRKRNLLAVDQSEFIGLCQLIQSKGIIRINGGRKKEVRLNRVCLVWNESEIVDALKDRQLLSSILQDNLDV